MLTLLTSKKKTVILTIFIATVVSILLYQHFRNSSSDISNTTPAQLVAESTSSQSNANQRVGKIHGLVRDYPFEEMVLNSDKIAKVKIIKAVSEISEPSEKTIFEVEVVSDTLSKNNKDSKTINVMQAGNSKWIFNDNPMFSEGESYVLFLKEAVGYDNTYWILGEETGVYEVFDKDILIKWSKLVPELSSLKDLSAAKKINPNVERYNKEFQIVSETELSRKINEVIQKQGVKP